MDLPGFLGFSSVNEFDAIKSAFTEYSTSTEYSALERYYQSANATAPLAEKQLPAKLFLETFELLLGRMEGPASPVIERVHAGVKSFVSRLSETVSMLSDVALPTPKIMHFVWVGGSEVGNIQRDYMNIWRAVLGPEDYRFNLWYDSDALLAFEMNRVILESARAHAMESGGDQVSKPSQLAQMIEDRARVLKLQMWDYINQPNWGGRRDEARIRLMVSAYGKDRAVLEAFRKKCLDTHLAMAGKNLSLRDVRHEFAGHFLQDVYEREVGMRGNFAAASDVVRLQAGFLEGGRYSDMDYLPPLVERLGGVDISAFSDEAKVGVLQLLLNEDDTLMPGRDRLRYKDRTDRIPAEHKDKLLAFAKEKPGVLRIFSIPPASLVPQDALRLGTAFGAVSSGEMNAHFLVHQRSGMILSYMEMIRENYDCLYEIERRLSVGKIAATDDSRVFDIILEVANKRNEEGRFLKSGSYDVKDLVSAIFTYYQDGIRIGARGTITLTGPGAAALGLDGYIENNLLPDHAVDIRSRLKLIEGYSVSTEEEMISGWTVNDDPEEWLTKEHGKWKEGKLRSRYGANLTELLKEQRMTFKQGWPVIEGKPVFLTDVLQKLMNDLGEPFIRAMRDKLSGEIDVGNRIDLGFDIRQQILAQPDSAIPVANGEQSGGNFNDFLTRLAHGSFALDQVSPLQRVVIGGLFSASRVDAEGFSDAWQKVLEVARETADDGFFKRYNTIEKILHERKAPAFEAGLGQGGAPVGETAGELKVRALAEPLTLYQWGQRIAQINSTARRDYQTKILKSAAQIRERFFKNGAVSARQVPQDLLRMGVDDPGRRCYPLALLMAGALGLGDKAERALIGRIANASLTPEDAGSRLMFAALDELSAVVPTEFGHSQGVLELDTIVQNLEGETGSAVYLLDTGKHALLVARILEDGKPAYRFFDPNFAIFGFSRTDQLRQGIQGHLASDAHLSRLYGLDGAVDLRFTVTGLDTKVIIDKVLPSKLPVSDFLKSEQIASGPAVSVWDAQASARMRSLSENVRMGEGLAQLDARHQAEQFEDAARRLRSEKKLGEQYLPLLETVQESSNKHYTLTMVDGNNPKVSIDVSTADSRFIKIARHIKRLAKAVAGPAQGASEADGGSRLSFAFAIQAIITEMRNREYQRQTGEIPALSIALQVQVYVSYAQLGFGVVTDTLQMVSLVRQVAASEKALAAGHASLASRLLGRAASTVGLGFSAVNIGFDIHGLTVATNEEQRSRLATQLTFNVAALGLDIAALAVSGTVGSVAAVLSVPLLGIGIGAAAIASNLGQISDKARAVGRHLFLINEAYTDAGHTIEEGVLRFEPEAVITELDLRRASVVFDSQKFFPTVFQKLGLPSFDARDQERHRAIDIREALRLPSTLRIDRQKQVDAVVLPCTPICYYGYEYQLGSSGFSPDEDVFERLKAYQRFWDYGDYSLPVTQDSGGLRTSYPNIIDGWKERLEFDERGEQRFQFFSTAPFPHVLYKLHPFNKPTVISVSLNQHCRQLVVPQLPDEWKNLISYEITAHSGQVQLTLSPGVVSVTLNPPPLVDGPFPEAFGPRAKADWVVAAPWASEQQLRFEGTVLIVDGIRIEGFEGFVRLKDGELFQVDRSRDNTLLLVRIDLESHSVSQTSEKGVGVEIGSSAGDMRSAAVLERLKGLRRANRLASPRIPVSGFAVPLTASNKSVLTTGYYDAVLDRILHPRNLPDAVNTGIVLGAVIGEHAWFYHPDHPTIWRVDAISGTVNHRYRLMNPVQGSKIIGFEGTVSGELRVVQEITGSGKTGYSLEYLIRGQELTFTQFIARENSDDLLQRTLEYWKQPLSQLMRPEPYRDESAEMSMSSSSWKAAPFIGLRCFDYSGFAYAGWLRLHDSRYVLHDFDVTQRTMLMWDQADNQDAIIYDRKDGTLIRVALSRTDDWDTVDDIIESHVVEMTSTSGRYIATKEDGRLFEVDREGVLRFIGVGQRWFELNPDWLDALPALAESHKASPFAVIGLARTSSPGFLAVWCIAGQMLLADIGAVGELTLLAMTPDAKAAWVFDGVAGKLYRQTLVDFKMARAAFAKGSRLLNPEHLPKAQPVAAQWQFSEVEVQGQGLLAQTRDGVNLELFDGQPARILGVESHWSDVNHSNDVQLRSRLQALISAIPHATFMPVGEKDGRYRYYVPESDQLFDAIKPLDGVWPAFLGIKSGSEPLMYDSVDNLIFTPKFDPAPSVSHWMGDCLTQRDQEVMWIASGSDFPGSRAVVPQGVEKLLLTFGSSGQSCRLTDEDWLRLDCIVIECQQSPDIQLSSLPVLMLELSANERLMLSVKDGQLVLIDPDDSHCLIVRSVDPLDDESAMQMEVLISIGKVDHRFRVDQLMRKIETDQVDKGHVEMKALIQMNG
ncbi:TcdA/TcdB pore-forming domain-containing protein [Pseudomonas sp. COW5]|uniref:TcdA/TcdB pore-forming domain-containing protein n=1 Tax=Pseudomonas sp. COW5 TaxID=2981253 RepID=UPI002245140E|nr:TcdA/TcdB pore-forming domain-containing protein [Pseudomonas sp. COW5]MCX2542784.1 hypothetical protein [Pseudomonas sp. COW5]